MITFLAHIVVPWPGLEPGSLHQESSALILLPLGLNARLVYDDLTDVITVDIRQKSRNRVLETNSRNRDEQ